jgi:DNA-binding NarL/FixJ family response regulator
LGRTRLLFRNSADVGRSQTAVEEGPPVLTTREREVLALLCRPLLDRDLFTEPATVREIATELVVSEAAVKQHLVNLYAKFGVRDSAVHRRSRLANEAIRRGAITLSEMRREPD